MKRILVVIVVLTAVLSAVLGVRLKMMQAYKLAPSGGTGTIEGVEVNVTARLHARITGITVREGDQVQAGQVLVELDCTETHAALAEGQARLNVARSSLESARAAARATAGNTDAARFAAQAAAAQIGLADTQKAGADKELQRLESLRAAGAIGDQPVDQLNTQASGMMHQVSMAKANEQAAKARADAAWRAQSAAEKQVAIAQDNVTLAEAVLRRAEIGATECVLKAPRAAVVLRRNNEPGEVAMPGTTVLTLVDISEVRTTFYLPNAELGAAAPGKKVTLVADAWPGERFPGTISYVSAKAEFTPRNVQTREDRDRLVYGVEVVAANPEGKLRPGMPAEVIIEGTGK